MTGTKDKRQISLNKSDFNKVPIKETKPTKDERKKQAATNLDQSKMTIMKKSMDKKLEEIQNNQSTVMQDGFAQIANLLSKLIETKTTTKETPTLEDPNNESKDAEAAENEHDKDESQEEMNIDEYSKIADESKELTVDERIAKIETKVEKQNQIIKKHESKIRELSEENKKVE